MSLEKLYDWNVEGGGIIKFQTGVEYLLHIKITFGLIDKKADSLKQMFAFFAFCSKNTLLM